MATQSMDWNSVQRDVEERLRQKPADDVKKKIVIPDPVPAGNHLAHFIRSIHWNSKGMLPSTAGSQRSYDKYNTVTRLSFQGPDSFKHGQRETRSAVSTCDIDLFINFIKRLQRLQVMHGIINEQHHWLI